MSSVIGMEDATVTLAPYIGKWAVQAVVPVISNFSGSVTATYATTFDYQGTFQCDALGYRTTAKDLAWIEMWAADHSGTDYFYCGKTKALEVPMSGTLPYYTGLWGHLGEGRAYDLYVKYRLEAGDESQLSAIVLSDLTNLGCGTPGLAANPSLMTGPVVASAAVASYDGAGNPSFDALINFTLTQPVTTKWIRAVLLYVVSNTATTPAPADPASTWIRIPVVVDGVYTGVTIANIPAGGSNIGYGWDVYVAYEDHAGNISATTLMLTLAANPLSGSSVFTPGSTSGQISSSCIPSQVPQSAIVVPLFVPNSSRVGATIFNKSVNNLYIGTASNTSLTLFTDIIPPGGYWKTPRNYADALYGIWDAAGTGFANISQFIGSPMVPDTINCTETQVSNTTSVTALLAADTSRARATIYNNSAANLYVGTSSSTSLTLFTDIIGPHQTWRVPVGYQGGIWGLWDALDAAGQANMAEYDLLPTGPTTGSCDETEVPYSATVVVLLTSNPIRLGGTAFNASGSNLYIGSTSETSLEVFIDIIAPYSYWVVPFNYTGGLWGIWDASAPGGQANMEAVPS